MVLPMLPEHELAVIAERVDLFANYGDADALRPGDVLALLGEVEALRRLHERDVRLYRQARDEATYWAMKFRELKIRTESKGENR